MPVCAAQALNVSPAPSAPISTSRTRTRTCDSPCTVCWHGLESSPLGECQAVSQVVGIRYSSTLAVTRSRHALTLYIPSSHTIHSLVRVLLPSVCVCVSVLPLGRQAPAIVLRALEALPGALYRACLLASPLAAAIQPLGCYSIIYPRRSCSPQPPYPSVAPCIHF